MGGSGKSFPLLRIMEGFLEEGMFNTSPKGSRGATKAQDEVGKAFLAEGTAWTKKRGGTASSMGGGWISNTGGLIFKTRLAAENSA